MPSRLLSEVRFGSFLAYSPKGTSDTSQRSRVACQAVKQWQQVGTIFERLRTDPLAAPLRGYLSPSAILVPAPRSAPLVTGALWPSRMICEAMVEIGLGREVVTALARVTPVRKSAWAARGSRPAAAEHLATMAVRSDLLLTGPVVIVDDVITKGATMLAGASLVADAYPDAAVETFALVRTLGLVPDVDRVVDPAIGVITLDLVGGCDREP